MKKLSYPFVPRTNKYLIPGQFWPIPLSNGTFACGRVLEVSSEYTKGFIAGLMDWVGNEPPTNEELRGSSIIKQGDGHIKMIQETSINGMIFGYRDLELDDLEVAYFRSQEMFADNCMLQKGYTEIRPITKEEHQKYSTFSTWGYGVIKFSAEDTFVKK
ncbi:immunity 26/phosphotriesterase HocA family protein [Priestia megaterium]|uniref:immunity 26/phosphotriesterase HocA family protein n=1 Tax=Priestia megaterium TaxID=1404 RepID=UPI0020A07A61|nr:immunity 26/phosphotriesterase HocA family protein [Priestia megaterium]MCP1452243.1 hypothetical protein [Priestia megaterium]